MAKFNPLDYYKDLPPWAKGTVIVIGTGITAYILIELYTKFKLDAKKMASQKEVQAANAKLKELASKGIKPTLSEANVRGFADQIIAAANDWGTDENAIYRVFQALKNEADMYLLLSVFGIREWKGTLTNFFDMERGDLNYLISYELSSSEVNKVNSILSSKGITYKF